MLLVIDNYDSFTWNLVHLIGAGRDVVVKRNDALTAREAVAMGPDAIVLSPGPGTPSDAGICVDLVRAAAQSEIPLFGVCLGLQSIAEALGGKIIRARKLMHGKTSRIRHSAQGLFENIPDRFTATRYHSLVADPDSLPTELEVVATSEDDAEIMALAHRTRPVAGVQFHPESIATEHGGAIFENFLKWAKR
ncbi:MAG: aminodeoxychorismate/anthranilate synthase component II [Alphaproteobacteria bacterium]|nr:aminodeoxychorismate/anthranilate synthase component II [Alphaproteobacteria bacterium]